MLIGEATKYGTGIRIIGDDFDLENLYETLHSLAGEEGTIGSDFILSFAYEVRKAFDGNREKKNYGSGKNKKIYFGFKLFWADFIVTLNLLRERAGYVITTREIQSNLYRLEAIAETTIKSYAPEIAEDILKYIFFIKTPYVNYLEPLLGQIINNCLNATAGKKRFYQLQKELILLNTSSFEHMEFKNRLEQEAKKRGCDLENIKYEIDIDENYKW
jgi:hypothetical protein